MFDCLLLGFAVLYCVCWLVGWRGCLCVGYRFLGLLLLGVCYCLFNWFLFVLFAFDICWFGGAWVCCWFSLFIACWLVIWVTCLVVRLFIYNYGFLLLLLLGCLLLTFLDCLCVCGCLIVLRVRCGYCIICYFVILIS